MRLDHLLLGRTAIRHFHSLSPILVEAEIEVTLRLFPLFVFNKFSAPLVGAFVFYQVKPDFFGGIAQLGEHLPCKQGVSGSIPLTSTTQFTAYVVAGKFRSLRARLWTEKP